MASTFTTFLNLEKPGIGEQTDTWGNTLNSNFDLIDDAFDGTTAITPDINGGTIDGATVGATTPSSGAFTTLSSTGAASLNSLSLTTDLAVTHGGTGASDAATARSNLGLVIGTNVQAWDANLDQIAALAVTDGNFIVGNGTAWVAESGATARTSLGLGTIATQDSTNINVDGGTIDGTVIGGASAAAGTFTTASATTAFRAADGSVSVPSYSFTSDTDTGMYLSGVGQLSFAVAGSERLRLGTANHTFYGDLIVDQTAPDVNFYASGVWYGGIEVTSAGVMTLRADPINIGASSYMAFDVDGSERMRITSGGLVGIGKTPVSYTLDVNGAIRMDGTAGDILLESTGRLFQVHSNGDANDGIIRVGSNRSADGASYIDLVSQLGVTSYDFRVLRNSGANGATELNHRGTGLLTLKTENAADTRFMTNNTERMRINSSGFVGIAKTALTAALDINGNVNVSGGDLPTTLFRSGTTGNSRVNVHGTLQAFSTVAAISWNATDTLPCAGFAGGKSKSGSVGTHTIVANGDNLVSFYGYGSDGTQFHRAAAIDITVDGTPGINDMPGRISFWTTPDGSTAPVERMRIDSSGNVGIGGTPLEKFHVIEGSNGLGTVANANADTAVFENNGDVGITLLSTNISTCNIAFGDTDNRAVGYIQYDHNSNGLDIATQGSVHATLTGAGRFGVGGTIGTINRTFEVFGISTEQIVAVIQGGNAAGAFLTFSDASTTNDGSVRIGASGDNQVFYTNGSERMRITSGGSVSVGSTSASFKFNVYGGAALMSHTAPNIYYEETDAGVNEKVWFTTVSAGQWRFNTGDDTFALGEIAYDVSRSGTTVTQHQWRTNGGTLRMRLDTSGNLLLGGTASPASATASLAIFNGTAPTGSVTNGVVLYSEDVAASAELKVRDEAGNITTLSPHNFSLIPEGPSEEMAWAYYSERGGKSINVDMMKLARLLERLTGEKLVYIRETAET